MKTDAGTGDGPSQCALSVHDLSRWGTGRELSKRPARGRLDLLSARNLVESGSCKTTADKPLPQLGPECGCSATAASRPFVATGPQRKSGAVVCMRPQDAAAAGGRRMSARNRPVKDSRLLATSSGVP